MFGESRGGKVLGLLHLKVLFISKSGIIGSVKTGAKYIVYMNVTLEIKSEGFITLKMFTL